MPSLLIWSRMVKQPRVVVMSCSTSDFFPTLLDAVDLPLPNRPYDGISLMPMIREQMTERPTPLYFEHRGRQKLASVAENPESQTASIEGEQPICEKLYEPHETCNPADSATHRELLAHFRGRCQNLMTAAKGGDDYPKTHRIKHMRRRP